MKNCIPISKIGTQALEKIKRNRRSDLPEIQGLSLYILILDTPQRTSRFPILHRNFLPGFTLRCRWLLSRCRFAARGPGSLLLGGRSAATAPACVPGAPRTPWPRAGAPPAPSRGTYEGTEDSEMAQRSTGQSTWGRFKERR